MATANFSKVNAQNYYAILDTYEEENEEGVMTEYQRDYWDFQILYDSIRSCCGDNFESSDKWNEQMDATELCTAEEWYTYGKEKKAWTTETLIESVICVRGGRYSGAVLDYDIKLRNVRGTEFYLSEFDNMDDMIDCYLLSMSEIIESYGIEHGWNIGTFKMHKTNIRKWLSKLVYSEIEKCEECCKKNCDVVLGICARFSNGETWYGKVG